MVIGGTGGSGHNERNLSTVDLQTMQRASLAKYTHDDWNNWCTGDCFDYCVEYNNDPCYRIETVGGGLATVVNWSANSDKWECLYSGWTPGGRFGEWGMNLIVTNHVDKKSINITQIPKGQGSGEVMQGHFWISSPVEDIVPELVEDLNNRDTYKIAGLDEGAMPLRKVARQENLYSASVRSSGESGILLSIPGTGVKKVKVFDARGILVSAKQFSSSLAVLPRNELVCGPLIVSITCDHHASVHRIMVAL
ncbi:MAG: hypothetical protein GF350_09215 [Chitinivibrionales bacterium]|nr:hypothetical protein [Chitinivibrionales bacterium]